MALTTPTTTATAQTQPAAEEATLTPEGTGQAAQQEATPEPQEPAAPATEQQAAAPESTAVATQPAAAPPAVANERAAAMTQFSQEQASQGFDGLDLTGMSFDRIKLHEGVFKLGSEEVDIGKDFECVIQATKRLYVVRQSTDEDAKAFYSYDPKGLTTTDGSESDLQEWIEEGFEETIDIKEYLEAVALLVNRDDEYDQSMVMLSIPPASRARVAGIAAQAQFRLKEPNLACVVIKASVGKQVGSGTKAFKPWNFSLVGRYEG